MYAFKGVPKKRAPAVAAIDPQPADSGQFP